MNYQNSVSQQNSFASTGSRPVNPSRRMLSGLAHAAKVYKRPLTSKSAFVKETPEYTAPIIIEKVDVFLNEEDINLIKEQIYTVFGKVNITCEDYTDPEEGWKRKILTIYSDNEDYQELFELEGKLFELIDSDKYLKHTLEKIIISQG